MAYFEAGLCLASTYLGYRSATVSRDQLARECPLRAWLNEYLSFQPPNKSPKEIFASEKDIGNSFLYKTLIFWRGESRRSTLSLIIQSLPQNYLSCSISDSSNRFSNLPTVFPTISGLAQTYFLLRYPDASIAWRREFNIGMILMISGGLLRVWSYRTLDKFFTFELSVSEEQKIIDKWPYALVRHPSYLALLPYLLGNFL